MIPAYIISTQSCRFVMRDNIGEASVTLDLLFLRSSHLSYNLRNPRPCQPLHSKEKVGLGLWWFCLDYMSWENGHTWGYNIIPPGIPFQFG
jgi:hypothetical protein